MRYLAFNWDDVSDDISDPSTLTDQEFEELANLPNGFVIENSEDFEARFNSEHFSTATHQLRIIDNITPELENINKLICENEIGAWESDLEETRTAVILEDFRDHDGEDGLIKYNGWGLKLLNLISLAK